MEYLIVCVVALLASGLTFFSGFGLGTILMPVLALFFPVPIAIAATAVVHFANNLFKLVLVGRSANKSVLLRFGVPAVIAALIGASLLSSAALLPVIAQYELMGRLHEITVVKLAIGLIIVIFSCLELIPRFAKMAIDKKHMVWGGLLSGFFGGLSGNQGALRSMFLIRAGLSKDEFIGTGIVSAVMVDTARLLVYGIGLFAVQFSTVSGMKGLILAATISAFAGALLGRELLKKITLRTVQIVVGVMLILLGLALSIGLI
ncbi:MAG: TSUP family transporter [Candidatus Omnitrophica bacterium]|nr:TSUP family transporter [Candidatus Omnitrophota bacterium]